MRFTNFINETTPGTSSKVNKMLMDIVSKFKQQTYDKDLSMEDKFKILMSLFKDQGIIVRKEEADNDSFVSQAFTNLTSLKVFVIFDEDNLEEFFELLDGKKVDNNKLLKELAVLIRALEHEFMHVEQLKKIPIKVRKFMQGISKENIKMEKVEAYEKYLSTPIEIEAFAYNIASQLRQEGTSDYLDLYKVYFESDSPVMKKLMKKIYFYQQEFKSIYGK